MEKFQKRQSRPTMRGRGLNPAAGNPGSSVPPGGHDTYWKEFPLPGESPKKEQEEKKELKLNDIVRSLSLNSKWRNNSAAGANQQRAINQFSLQPSCQHPEMLKDILECEKRILKLKMKCDEQNKLVIELTKATKDTDNKIKQLGDNCRRRLDDADKRISVVEEKNDIQDRELERIENDRIKQIETSEKIFCNLKNDFKNHLKTMKKKIKSQVETLQNSLNDTISQMTALKIQLQNSEAINQNFEQQLKVMKEKEQHTSESPVPKDPTETESDSETSLQSDEQEDQLAGLAEPKENIADVNQNIVKEAEKMIENILAKAKKGQEIRDLKKSKKRLMKMATKIWTKKQINDDAVTCYTNFKCILRCDMVSAKYYELLHKKRKTHEELYLEIDLPALVDFKNKFKLPTPNYPIDPKLSMSIFLNLAQFGVDYLCQNEMDEESRRTINLTINRLLVVADMEEYMIKLVNGDPGPHTPDAFRAANASSITDFGYHVFY